MREKGEEGKKEGRENGRDQKGEMEGQASLYTLSRPQDTAPYSKELHLVSNDIFRGMDSCILHRLHHTICYVLNIVINFYIILK